MENIFNSDTVHKEAPVLSVDVGPDTVGNAHLNRQLQENFVLKQVVNIWQRPKHPEYCGLIDPVHSFKHVVWPETSPTPASLAEAGFFYGVELTTI